MSESDGGFAIEVKAVAGTLWRLEGTSGSHKVGAIKERLVGMDARFRTHRSDLVLGAQVLGDLETLKDCGVGPNTRLSAVFSDLRAAVLVIGGGVAGRTAVTELSNVFPDQWVVLVDTQEYAEHACGVVRAVADPAAWECIATRHEDALCKFSNVQFVQGEVMRLRPGSVTVACARDGKEFIVRFQYCVIATGCSFAPMWSSGESLWKPTALKATRESSQWPMHDERTIVGRRHHILREHNRLWEVSDKGGTVLVVGARYHGVELACDLQHFFAGLKVVLIDQLPRCLGNLPEAAAEYAERYMQSKGIRTCYGVAYEPEKAEFWQEVGVGEPANIVYNLQGMSARNQFMPAETLSSKGPGGGGGWIVTNSRLQVCLKQRGSNCRPGQVWASGKIFAVGDCVYGAVMAPSKKSGSHGLEDFAIPPVPKTSMAAISWARVASRNIVSSVGGWPLEDAAWPVEAGIVAVSLGDTDGVVVWKVRWTQNSGEVVLTGEPAAALKKRLTWRDDREWLTEPSKWLRTFQEGLPASRLLPEQGRSVLGLSSRAW